MHNLNIRFNCLKIAKVDFCSNCVCLKLKGIRFMHIAILSVNCIFIFLFYGKRTTSKFIVIQKALTSSITTVACALKLSFNSIVALGEGPSFFQNFHLSIYVFLRIYASGGSCKL
ncbi:hypothetical protein Anas_13663, partial [Armadillidium nasatum]